MDLDAKPPLSWWGSGMDAFVYTVVAFLICRLVALRFFATFHIGPYPNPPPGADVIAQYWIAAGIAFGLVILGYVVATLHRRLGSMIVYPILGFVTLIVALVFAVPSIDWSSHRDSPYPPNPNYCSRTDSENCPGG
jgi:hypothetical protein